jgi:hypothetical protein
MKTLTFDKLFLSQRLRENRARHEEIYNEAVIGYQKAAVEKLSELLEKIKSNPQEKIYFNLPYPTNHLKDYDRVIMMFDQCVESEIELDQQEYSRYIQDNWEWSQTFLTLNSGYSPMASGCLAR